MTSIPAPDPMPVFVIKAKDMLAIETISHYLLLCRMNGLYDQAEQVGKAMTEILHWQARNGDLLQLPDHTHVPVTGAS